MITLSFISKKHLFISGFVLLSRVCFSQSYIDYYNLANEAEHQMQVGNYITTKNILVSLKKKYKDLKPKEHLYLGIVNYMDKDTINGFIEIEKSIKGYLISKETREHYFKKISTQPISEYSQKEITLLENRTLRFIDSTRSSKDMDTLISFLELYTSNDRGEKSITSINVNTYYDSQVKFLSYLRRKGLPNCYLYGSLYYLIFSNILDKLHYQYKELLYDNLKLGKICPVAYALLIDKKVVEESNGFSTEYGSTRFPAVENREKINKNRKKIGMNIYDCNFLCDCTKPIISKTD